VSPTAYAQATIRATIERLVRDIGNIAPDDSRFGESTDLFDSGYIDSLGIVSLTARIETEFGVTPTEQDLFDPRFTTIAGMAEIIAARLTPNRP
jgi:acyl carrier protein